MQHPDNADLIFKYTVKEKIGRALYGPFAMPAYRNLRTSMGSLFDKARGSNDFNCQPPIKLSVYFAKIIAYLFNIPARSLGP